MSQRNNNFSGLNGAQNDIASFLKSEVEKKKEKKRKRKSWSILIVARQVAPFVFALLCVKYSRSRFEFFRILIRQGARLFIIFIVSPRRRTRIYYECYISHGKPPVWSYTTLFIRLRRFCTSVMRDIFAWRFRIAFVCHLFIFRVLTFKIC